jgi:lysophospholipid acyltransferase (LPLAT)-like uncharacterized protein
LPSWDRIEIPKPFTRAFVVIGERFYLKDGDGDADGQQQRFQMVLDELRRESDRLSGRNGRKKNDS